MVACLQRESVCRRRAWISVVVIGLAAGLSLESLAGPQEETRPAEVAKVDFPRDIAPLFRQRCIRCHGPRQREGGLRLTSRVEAFTEGDSGEVVIQVGDRDQSILWQRISAKDDSERMPPEGSPLTDEQVALVGRWIEQGASWPSGDHQPQHWAYRRVSRPALVQVTDTEWPINPIDRFILARLEQQNRTASKEADRATLLRRASLALTGLPPTLEQLDRFLADTHVGAYERIVDRLLASDAYGEHWARPWLDLARYADSNGFQADQIRDSWAYRDWVIQSMNQDQPFDQFVVDQLAGDLLPDATARQRVATGFHRTVTCNVEAGVHPEENRVNQVFDRVNTTGTVFLGTTLECCQCHNHKYDPFTQREYYQLFACFNNTPIEVKQTAGVTFDFIGPSMELSWPAERKRRHDALQSEYDKLQEQADKPAAKIKKIRQQLEATGPPTTLVMIEQATARETRIMVRGDYLQPGKRVTFDTPASLHPFNSQWPRNRLGLARWLTSRENPLLARVTVNRWWMQLFGRGIVNTPEDFGTRCEPPSHPLLLDWLAAELMDRGWSRKRVLKQMVMSRTFRQTSHAPPDRWAQDPHNEWCGRGPRWRMPAEVVRDNALAVSGLLNRKMGGPPVMPYQPPGIWRAVGRNAPKWETALGTDRYRRGVYVIWRRAAPYPSFVTFDAPDRAACVVQRARTNTPLQALALLNDPTYAEAALALAVRMDREAVRMNREAVRMNREGDGSGLERPIALGFRLCTSRMPSPAATTALVALYEAQHKRLEEDEAAVASLLTCENGYQPPADEFGPDLAAWFFVANALLNLDQTITVD